MDNKELEKIYNDTYRSVYWTAMSLLKDEDDAQDIVQETFVTLIDSYDTLKDKNKVAAWLKKIAANKCLDRLRRTKTVNAEDDFFENVEAQPEDFLPESLLESAEKRRIIMNIIDNALSDDVRRTLILYYYDEMTTKEIASLLDIPQGTVLWRLNFAKKKIKKEVEKYEDENNDKLYAMAAVPFLTKLFAKEAEQVPLKPITASLLNLSASSDVPAKAATAKTAASAATKGMAGLTLNKIMIALAAFILAVIAAIIVIPPMIEKNRETSEETTASQTEETEDAVAGETTDDASATDTAADPSVLIGTWVTALDDIYEYISFDEDGTYTGWHVNADGVEVTRTTGTYTVEGNEITLPGGGVFTFGVDGDTLTLANPDNTDDSAIVYTRADETAASSSASTATADSSTGLIGTWSYTQGNSNFYISFGEDGTMTVLEVNLAGVEIQQLSFTYTIEGNEMIWYAPDGSESSRVGYTVDGDTLTLVNSAYPDEPLVLSRSNPYGTPEYTAADLAGTWSSYGDDAHFYVTDDYSSYVYIYMTFNEDGTLDARSVDSNGAEIDQMTDTFVIEGNQLTISYPNGKEPETYTISIDGDSLRMAPSYDPEDIYTYTREA